MTLKRIPEGLNIFDVMNEPTLPGVLRTEIVSVQDNVATVNFYRNDELLLTRPIPIPEQAGGSTDHESFQTILTNYGRYVTYNAVRVGVQAPTVERP